MRLTPSREPGSELESRDQATRVGAAAAGNIERGSVIRRGSYERQSERYVDGMIERQCLDRNERLIVIHGERDVVAGTRGLMKQRVGRKRTARIDSFRPELLDGGMHQGQIFIAERPVLACMRIEAG